MKQGLPQGSVLSPLLFLLFIINSVVEAVPQNVTPALYVDDLRLPAQHQQKECATNMPQKAVDRVTDCSKRKMVLNVKKSEITFFSTDSHEASWTPTITVEGKERACRSTVRRSYWASTSSMIAPSVFPVIPRTYAGKCSRCRVLRALATKSWRWRKDNLHRVYLALQQSVMHQGGNHHHHHQGGNHGYPNRCWIAGGGPKQSAAYYYWKNSTNPRL